MKTAIGQATQASARVRKALDDNEKQIVGDIRALLDKLDQIEVAEEQPAAATESPANDLLAMAMKAAEATGIGEDGEPEVPKDEDDKAAKATANDTAEVRIKEDNPEANDAITLVGKALLSLLAPQQKVAKSARAEIDEGLITAITRLNEQTQINTKALQGILEGVGMSELIAKAAPVQPRQAIQQTPNDLAQVLASVFKSALAGNAAKIGGTEDDSVPEGGMGYVLKSLATMGPAKVGNGNS